MFPRKITDHAAQGLARLTSRWTNMPRARRWLGVYLREIQALEDAIWDLLDLDFLDSATGRTLDVYGILLKQPRLGLSDAVFRIFLRARVAVNRSSGHPNDVIKVARLLVARNWYVDQFPRSFTVEIDPGDFDVDQVLAIGSLIGSARAVNSACEVLATEAEGAGRVFRFGALNTEEAEAENGFATEPEDGETGGNWAYTVPH